MAMTTTTTTPFSTFSKSEKEQYSVEELGTCFNFDAKTIEWFKKRPFDPEDPVVIFDFTAAYPHGDGGPNRISFNAVATTILEVNQRIERIEFNIFFFPTYEIMGTAKLVVLRQFPGLFHSTPTQSEALRAMGLEPTPAMREVKVNSVVITSVADEIYKRDSAYDFFGL